MNKSQSKLLAELGWVQVWISHLKGSVVLADEFHSFWNVFWNCFRYVLLYVKKLKYSKLFVSFEPSLWFVFVFTSSLLFLAVLSVKSPVVWPPKFTHSDSWLSQHFWGLVLFSFSSLKTGRALTKKLHTFSLFLFKKAEQSNRNKQNLFIKIPQMGNIILGPFEETTLCYDRAWMMKFSTHALSPGTSPVFLPSYNLFPREVCPLKNPFSPSDGLDSSQAIGGVVEGKVWEEGFNHLLWGTNHKNTQVQNGNWWLAPIFHLFFRNRGKCCVL